MENGFYQRKAGEALHPARESLQALDVVKSDTGYYNFTAQYQQNPAPKDGDIIQKKWLNRYDTLPENPDYIVQGYDTASKAGDLRDYSACVTCLVKDGVFYVADVMREKLSYPDLRHKVMERYQIIRSKYPNCQAVLAIENKSSGITLIDELQKEGIKVEVFNPKGDKESRVYNATAKFENRTFLLPKVGIAPWLADYEDELLRFPNGKHDDQVDATIVALSCFGMNFTPTPQVKPLIRRMYTGKYRSSNQGMDERNGLCDSRGRLSKFGISQIYRPK